MTDQPTAPQTWDTLPDDPDAIPFPIVVGWEGRKSESKPRRSGIVANSTAEVACRLRRVLRRLGLPVAHRTAGQVDWTATADGPETLATWTRYHGDPDWWMPWPTFAPDPMTVNDWHDMSLLPDGHPEWVFIEFEDGNVGRARGTRREDDAELGRKRWRSEAAMLAHVGGAVEGES